MIDFYSEDLPSVYHSSTVHIPSISRLSPDGINSSYIYVHQTELPAGQLQISLNISHLPAGRYNIEIYPLENKERIFYGTQVVKV